VQLEEIDVIGAQPAEAGVNRAQQLESRRSDVVWTRTVPETGLRGNQHPIAPPGDRLAQNLLRQPVGIRIRAVEHRQPGVKANVHEARRFLCAGVPPVLEEVIAAAECAGAEREDGDGEAGPSQ
jgi:hypothetical protein